MLNDKQDKICLCLKHMIRGKIVPLSDYIKCGCDNQFLSFNTIWQSAPIKVKSFVRSSQVAGGVQIEVFMTLTNNLVKNVTKQLTNPVTFIQLWCKRF
jgi:hypothetical protein